MASATSGLTLSPASSDNTKMSSIEINLSPFLSAKEKSLDNSRFRSLENYATERGQSSMISKSTVCPKIGAPAYCTYL
jgi:hypothetical protein